MKKYYVVYDATPYDERNENYNQIGIGIQNSNAEMLARHYNIQYPGFHPTAQSEDSSHTMPGYADIYNHDKIAPLNPVTPVQNNTTPSQSNTTNYHPNHSEGPAPMHDPKHFMPNENIHPQPS